MLLRGMHDRGCDDIYVIVTDLKRNEMDQVTEYFKYVCQNTAGGHCKPSVEQKINHDCKCRSFTWGLPPFLPPVAASQLPRQFCVGYHVLCHGWKVLRIGRP